MTNRHHRSRDLRIGQREPGRLLRLRASGSGRVEMTATGDGREDQRGRRRW
jgi:hypothetical protein